MLLANLISKKVVHFGLRLMRCCGGAPITDVLVSDDPSLFSFIAAVADVPPERLETAVAETMGIRHQAMDRSKFPVRQALPGSQIIYFQKKSKIFCAKSKQIRPN